MPKDDRCYIGKIGRSVSCKGAIREYESNPFKCSIQTCTIKNSHKHRLCEDCGKYFLIQKQNLEKR